MKPDPRRGALAVSAAIATLGLAAIPITLPRAGQSAAPPGSCRAPDEVEARIDFYSRQVAAHPRLYPALALLGKAYLDRVRWTGNPHDLLAARNCLERSINVQSNLAAYKVYAAVENYSHRFEQALHWCNLAAGVAPHDPEILAMRFEALSALDRPDEAAALLSEIAAPDTSFHAVACRGMVNSIRGDREQALVDFARAADLANERGSQELAIWAHIASAALFLDHGAAAAAEPYLWAAEQISPDDYDLQVHLAEFDEGTGRLHEAVVRYERLLTLRCDAEVHRRLYVLARQLGQTDKAARHFQAAEHLWRTALDQGEVYPLEGLANLYCDAGNDPAEALRLAERNLQFKRDASARHTLERARSLQTPR